MYELISIGIGATLGAWLRWGLSTLLNHVFPTIPFGTLAANLLGGFLIGIVMGVTRDHTFIPHTLRLAITTGFLGGLTTFSTFSAESTTLLIHQEYLWTAAIVIFHVAGSILATLSGIYLVKWITL